MAVACIATCALLHNVLLMRGDVDHSSSPPPNISFGDDDHTARQPLEVEDCSNADDKAIILRNALAMKARALRHATQISFCLMECTSIECRTMTNKSESRTSHASS
ncbi:uncharacterized protein A4U43_C08F21200 [Asparagus officinalis]|uniref:uncharacterized protein LOC109820036 n=1 Tax=Asparagus officinalis TaxID=4686 RepID=UPI00098DEBF9|nr:uncharacterized protein LOC109820036 [Asparagus officinalis]ONK60664.1 uncharacterized protein A4U43_C08F21200 [Asparagus officinalis]